MTRGEVDSERRADLNQHGEEQRQAALHFVWGHAQQPRQHRSLIVGLAPCAHVFETGALTLEFGHARRHMLFLAGPRRPLEAIDKRLRDLFLDMNATSINNDFDSAPHDEIDPPAAERLGEISAPTLVVIGDEDVAPIFDATELLIEKVRGARKVTIHDAAHLPNLEHPEEFNRVVLDFLLG